MCKIYFVYIFLLIKLIIMHKSSGYILILTLLLLSTSFILISSILQKTFAYISQSRIEVDREYAEQLALSGIQIALSKLALIIPESQEKKPDQENSENKANPEQQWLANLLLILNKWQQLSLTKNAVGIDGIIKYNISAQQGKFNLNYISPAINELIKKTIKIDIFSLINQSNNKYGRAIQDPTELTQFPELLSLKNNIFTNFFEQTETGAVPISLMDLLYIQDENNGLNPWLLSSSVLSLLGLPVPKYQESSELLKKAVSQFQQNINWSTGWDKILYPIYKKKLESINPNVRSSFSNKFIADSFFVVCHATVGSITQKVAALLQIDKNIQGFSSDSKIYKIAQLYWI